MNQSTGPERLIRGFRISWWWGFSVALVLPIALLGFLLSGPHRPEDALAWMLPVPCLILLDTFSGPERRRVPTREAGPLVGIILSGLAVLAPLNLLALGAYIDQLSMPSGSSEAWALCLDLLALRVLGGTTFCCSVIAPAHELMHRRPRWIRRVARGMLMLVFSDVFYFSHGGGHHRHLGRQNDPSTAKVGERYSTFLGRSLTAQWKTAYRLHPKAFRQGLLIEGMLLLGFGFAFGILAAVVWLYLSGVAIRLLEAVNYFQHYGLTEESGRGRYGAWRCDGALSFFLFLGLTRHADHHRRPMIPFTDLEAQDEGPELPLGYLGTAIWVKNHSASFGRFAERRLKTLA